MSRDRRDDMWWNASSSWFHRAWICDRTFVCFSSKIHRWLFDVRLCTDLRMLTLSNVWASQFQLRDRKLRSKLSCRTRDSHVDLFFRIISLIKSFLIDNNWQFSSKYRRRRLWNISCSRFHTYTYRIIFLSLSGAVRVVHLPQCTCSLHRMCIPAILVEPSLAQLSHFLRALHELLHSKFLQKEVTQRPKATSRTAASEKSWMRSKTLLWHQKPPFRLYCKRFIMLIHRSQVASQNEITFWTIFFSWPSKKFQSWNFFVRFQSNYTQTSTSGKIETKTFFWLFFSMLSRQLFDGLKLRKEAIKMRISRLQLRCVSAEKKRDDAISPDEFALIIWAWRVPKFFSIIDYSTIVLNHFLLCAIRIDN